MDPIKDALRAAAVAIVGARYDAPEDDDTETWIVAHAGEAAAAVAAFLRALPGPGYVGPQPHTAWITPLHMQNLAAAVEKAARDE